MYSLRVQLKGINTSGSSKHSLIPALCTFCVLRVLALDRPHLQLQHPHISTIFVSVLFFKRDHSHVP